MRFGILCKYDLKEHSVDEQLIITHLGIHFDSIYPTGRAMQDSSTSAPAFYLTLESVYRSQGYMDQLGIPSGKSQKT